MSRARTLAQSMTDRLTNLGYAAARAYSGRGLVEAGNSLRVVVWPDEHAHTPLNRAEDRETITVRCLVQRKINPAVVAESDAVADAADAVVRALKAQRYPGLEQLSWLSTTCTFYAYPEHMQANNVASFLITTIYAENRTR